MTDQYRDFEDRTRKAEGMFRAMRRALDGAFAPDTSNGAPGEAPSAGHCAAVAWILREKYGADYVSATVEGQSHWFGRLDEMDVDLTGDQFGRPAIQIGPAGTLYEGTRQRAPEDMNEATAERGRLLAERAGLITAETRNRGRTR